MEDILRIRLEAGAGRAFIILYEEGARQVEAQALGQTLSESSRVLVIEAARITDSNWSPISSSLQNLLREKAVRQASFVGFGPAGSILQHLSLLELKLVRTLVLVDPTSRPHPGLFTRIIDRIENLLPLGLPLRSRSRGFDSKAFLQRIRCPILIARYPDAGGFVAAESETMASSCPTAWLVDVKNTEDLSANVIDFQGVPARCPQKNQPSQQVQSMVSSTRNPGI